MTKNIWLQDFSELSFLKEVLEMTSAGEIDCGVIRIEEHVKASVPEIVYQDEITEAPAAIQETMKWVDKSKNCISKTCKIL